MSRLVNEFSWSFSRHNTFEECQKKYWYIYYGSWEGWPLYRNDPRPSIDPLAAYLYTVKQMQSLAMFVGTVVHGAIEKCLKDWERSRRFWSQDRLIKEALAQFRKGIQSSKDEAWRKSPKYNANLFEIYFKEKGEEGLGGSEIQAAEEKIQQCLENWYNSPITQKTILGVNANTISIEKLDTFYLKNKYKVFVVIDYAMKWQMNHRQKILLFDWKTGKETDKTIDQLYSYALFAHQEWKTPYNEIVLAPFYLHDNHYEKVQGKESINPQRLALVEDFIVSSSVSMVEQLMGEPSEKLEKNQADPLSFAYTENRGKCVRCPFKKLCESQNYKNSSLEELKEEVEGIGL
ncbi:MAG: hypothetical protein CMO81_09960 [Waddliaceae bacterium]|nr:hypothetical protein [Waddliaceae bacterium]